MTGNDAAGAARRRGRPGYNLAAVLDGAVEVFNERGFDRTRVEDVARRLGVSKSAIYHHVTGKEQLLGLALDRALDGLFAVADDVTAAGGRAVDRLEQLVRGSVDVLSDRLPYVTLLVRVHGGTAVERRALQRRRRFDQLVAGLVAEAVADGDVRQDIDPALTSRLLFGMVNSLVEWYRPRRPASPADIADVVVRVAFDGLRAPGEDHATTRARLHDGWVLALDPNRDRLGGSCPATVAATVPGCVHLDLLAAGLIPDPYVDRNEVDVQWVGEAAWSYRLNFDATVAARSELVFAGVDGFATVTLNGTCLGRAENQHRTYRFDASTLISAAGNELVVAFDAPATHAAVLRDQTGDLPNPYATPYNFVRKMACNFGWDWGPQLTTSGLWRPVVLEQWDVVRIRSIRPRTGVATGAPVAGERGRVDVAVDLDLVSAARDLRVRSTVTSPDGRLVASGEGTPDAEGRTELTLDVADVARWWPTGYGAQPCYRLDVEVGDDVGCHDRAGATIGFRDVRLDTSDRPDGRTFAIHVNGERIWIRGVNWIPADCFPSRNHGALVTGLLGEAVQANANLVRVWGGGVYESDQFYAECDRRGLLVWQDFAFACAAYPEALLHDEVAAEAVDNVTRLASHPSLALWCGNNECLEGWSDWDWQAAVGDRPWGDGFYRHLLPRLVAELDPDRPYIDGTPTALDPAITPNGADHGTVHLWDVWNRLDYEHYRAHRPRFAAEFGFQAPATAATLAAAVTTRPLAVASAELQHHQKAVDGEAKLRRSLEHHFGAVDDFDDWLYLTQVNQARAIEVGVGHLRSLHERCSGVVWWQLDDCWPAISWAVVDRAGRRKPSWYALRRSFADRLLVFEPRLDDGGVGLEVDLVLVNDSATAWDTTVTFHRVADGAVDAVAELTARVAPRASSRLAIPATCDPGDGLVVATAGALRAVHGPAGSDRRPATPRWATAVELAERSVAVTVEADTVVRDLCLFADRIDPWSRVDEQLVTLLPGESHTFTVETRGAPARAAWTRLGRPGGSVLRAIGDREPSDR